MALQPLEERVTRLELGHIESKQESTESRMLTKADIRKLEADVAELKRGHERCAIRRNSARRQTFWG